jgi:hypothetical protein
MWRPEIFLSWETFKELLMNKIPLEDIVQSRGRETNGACFWPIDAEGRKVDLSKTQ